MSLFRQAGEFDSVEFTRLRNERDTFHSEQRKYIDALWNRTKSFLDSNFVSEFARQTPQRFWELRLAATLLDLNFELERTGEGRPDFCTRTKDGHRLWIEAVSPTLGHEGNPDRAPDGIADGRFRAVPEEALLLRYTQALAAKHLAFQRFREAGIVSASDRCVIAISSSALGRYSDRDDPPRIMGALFPVGRRLLRVDPESLDIEAMRYDFRDAIRRTTGTSVSTAMFLAPAYADISGVILDSARATGWRQQAYGLFKTIHNPLATLPLPKGWFSIGHEYVVTHLGDRNYEMEWTAHCKDGSPSGP